MFEIIVAGGWIMLPIICCSVIALAIVAERCWMLRTIHVVPDKLVDTVIRDIENNRVTLEYIRDIGEASILGKILASGLKQFTLDSERFKATLLDAGRHAIHDLERYLSSLGTIASITPLLGLLGTVVGMIDVFSTMVAQGVGNAQSLAGGISQALITTAAGLTVAIPSLAAYRFIQRRIDELTVELEQETMRFVSRMPRRSRVKSTKDDA